MLEPLSSTERKVLIANLRYAKTKDEKHFQKLNMDVELWYLAQDSLVEKQYANWTKRVDFTEARVGETSDVITPGMISVTGLGRVALKANTFPRRVYRAVAKETPKVIWLVVTALSGVATGAAGTLLAQWLSKT